jgi:hypothetical protein
VQQKGGWGWGLICGRFPKLGESLNGVIKTSSVANQGSRLSRFSIKAPSSDGFNDGTALIENIGYRFSPILN